MRLSNIELCRILSIILVLIVHSSYAANGFPTTLDSSSLWLITLQSFSIIGVNVFIFISGYFSIKLKPKTIYTLVFICAFYFILLTGIALLLGYPFKITNLLFVSKSHAFIFSYLCLVMASPMLNTFAEKADKKTFSRSLLMFIIFQIWFTYLPGIYVKSFHYGYGLISYSVIYLIARYVKLYGIPQVYKKYSGTIYILSTVLLIIAACTAIKIGFPQIQGRLFAYNNPVIMISSISFFLFFEKIKIRDNKYINHIAKSTLAVLLLHASSPAAPLYKHVKELYKSMAQDINMVNIIKWGGVIIAIFIIAITIDQLRIYLQEKLFNKINK